MPTSFDTSHNKKVEGNYTGLVKRDTKRSARQYMNRIGAQSIAPLPPLSPALGSNFSASTLGLQVVSTGRCPRRKLTGERTSFTQPQILSLFLFHQIDERWRVRPCRRISHQAANGGRCLCAACLLMLNLPHARSIQRRRAPVARGRNAASFRLRNAALGADSRSRIAGICSMTVQQTCRHQLQRRFLS